jgi:DNA-binding CsgD family transcriptional regulator/tetratricopeptide (TPR) repeat protein
VCPVLVGRDHELVVIEELLERAREGRGQTLCISGEAGIGKSRLVARLTEVAERNDMLVLRAACFEGDRGVPYAAVAELLMDIAAHAESGPGLWPPGVVETLAHAVPELRDVAPELGVAEDASPRLDARRVRRALQALLAGLAQSHSLVLVFEDVHWADEASGELLGHVARQAMERPILLVLTCRSNERASALDDLRASLTHDRLGVELELLPLGVDELAIVLQACIGSPEQPPTEFTRRVHQLTDGNPFFVEEVVRTLVMSTELTGVAPEDWPSSRDLPIPRSIRDSVSRRLERVAPLARRFAEFAAVLGRRFDPHLVHALLNAEAREIVLSVKVLVDAGLIVQESDDRLAFRHALTWQAIYMGLLGVERRALHRQAAEILELRSPRADDQSRLADLARHWQSAGVADRALEYARRAAELSLSLSAPRSAVEHLSTALATAQAVERAPIALLYRLRGEAYDLLGEFDAALADFEAAVATVRANRDERAEWELLLRLALLWAARDFEQSRRHTEAALQKARALGDEALAHTLNRLGNSHLNAGQLDDALRHHEQALTVFQRRADRRGMAQTLELLGMASNLADPTASVGYYDRAIPLLTAVDERQGVITALAVRMLQNGSYWHATFVPAALSDDEAWQNGQRALRLARESAWRAGEAFVLWEMAAWLGPRGHYQRALDAVRHALAITEEIDHPAWQAGAHLALGATFLDLLDHRAAMDHLRRVLALSAESDQRIFGPMAAGLLASALIRAGQPRVARELLESGEAADTSMRTMGPRTVWLARAEYAVACGADQQALDITQRLIASVSSQADPIVVPALDKLRGEALGRLGRRAEAVDVLSAARTVAHAQNLRGMLWRLNIQLGRIQRGLGERLEANRSFEAARQTIDELAGELDDPSVRDRFLQLATGLLPARRAPTERQLSRARFGGLTARERDVARLVAAGRSNRQISQALVLSERTVEVYVTSILSKLNSDSRAQIAVWAVRVGLAADPG